MQLHKPTEPIAERPRTQFVRRGLVCTGLLVLGCSRPPPDSDDDSQGLPDVPADLPNDSTEYEGVLYGIESAYPTHFWECQTAEQFEMSYAWHPWQEEGEAWMGSCYGVYNRVRGHLDRSFDPPRLFIQETLEARWSTPSDCVFFHEPDYESCALEDDPEFPDTEFPMWPCWPVEGDCPHDDDRCSPVRFDATEFAGWKDFDCIDAPEYPDGPGDACEYSGDVDTCLDRWRCWNPDGDLTKPGVCVPYCDLNDAADPCVGTGTCVRCSSSDRWGLCMTDCSGEDCNVDAFC
jgi:hypothetical protein